MANVNVVNEGTLFQFFLDVEAIAWVKENVADPMWLGPTIVVEPRYARDLAQGMLDAGLSVA